MKPVYSLDLSPRYNVYAKPRPIVDVGEIIGASVLGLLIYIILVLVLA